MITLQEALEWAIAEVEQDTAPVTTENPDGNWQIHKTPFGEVIYGLSGSRYFIRGGPVPEVVISASHCSTEVLCRALNAGFRIE